MIQHIITRRNLLVASSMAAMVAAAPVHAQELEDDDFMLRVAPERASVVNTPQTLRIETPPIEAPVVVPGVKDPNLPGPDGVLDQSGVNGIGQMFVSSGSGGFGLCTGSLVNHRMVIFAAHCVNSRAADEYGAATGGTPIAFGFEDDNSTAVGTWSGNNFQTNEARSVYNVEHVWYDTRSLDGDSRGFLQADVAIATLDTPAFDIPKWALLFSPLDGQEHVTVTGYGRSGTGATGDSQGIDWRRRAGENLVSWLGSLDNRNTGLGFFSAGTLPQNLYWVSQTCEAGNTDPQCADDYGIFGSDDVAQPFESVTAGGDSGGPLIVDQKWATPVIAGVLSGGTNIDGDSRRSDFGDISFYQPLHVFWDVIVPNNPLVYASAKAGEGRWAQGSHWVQQLDPAYMVERNGNLVNGVPSTRGAGITGAGAAWGDICDTGGTCSTFDSAAVVETNFPYLRIPGGPRSSGFVPNNITADPANGIAPKYYSVILDKDGRTNLLIDVEIDTFDIRGNAELFVRPSGSLTVLGDFVQMGGNVINTGGITANDILFGAGLVTGRGRFTADFSTVATAVLAPGGISPDSNTASNTLYAEFLFDGNLIMTSGSTFLVDVNDTLNDSLRVFGQASLSSATSAGGVLTLRNPSAAAAPRAGQEFTIIRATGGIEGQFQSIDNRLGSLQAQVIYGTSRVFVRLRGGSLSGHLDLAADYIAPQDFAVANAFAEGLDDLREAGHYETLYNLFGSIDVMDPYTLAGTLSSLAPSFNSEGSTMQERQSRALTLGVTDRLSLMGNAAGGSLSITGTPRAAINGSYESASVGTRLGVAGLAPSNQAQLALPEGVTGFVTGGVISSANSFGVNESAADGQRSSYFGMGIEHEMADDLHVGVAFGRASGRSNIGGDFADSELNQVAGYASYQLGGGAYVGAVGTLEMAELETTRSGFDGSNSYQLLGASEMTKLTAMAEAGVNVGLSKGLTLTPRVQMAYSNTRLSGFNELGGETALQIDDLQSEQLEARFGAKLAGHQGVTGKWSIVPQVQADYVRVVDGSDDGLTVRFAGASDVPIALPFAGGDTSWGEVRGGVQLTNGTVQFGASFETAIGREAYRDDRAMADFTVRF